MVFFKPGNGRLRILLSAMHFGQHDAELNATGVIHLRANNVVIHIKAASCFGQQRRIYSLAGKFHTQHRYAVCQRLLFQALQIVFWNVEVQCRLNKLLRQRRFGM